jgi:acetylornithine deacetylase
MANQSGVCGGFRAGIEQRLQPARGAVEKQRPDRWCRKSHTLRLQELDRSIKSARIRIRDSSVCYPLQTMDAITLTRQLIDIESISGNETAVGNYLYGELCRMGYRTMKMPVDGARFNVYALPPDPEESERRKPEPPPPVVFSTHMDTVPPFIASSEDAGRIYGRGSCDAKGIIAAQIAASERLRRENIPVGLLFVVGEERDSLGAKVANEYLAKQDQASGKRYLINGEPTENRIALASKGTLRVEVTARGRMAHSAYPELGESAIDKLLSALARLRAMPLPSDPEIGPCTLNIGLIEGGRAPNVIPDYAHADLLYRLVEPSEKLRRQIVSTAGEDVEITFPLELPFLRLRSVDGVPTMIAAFTTDIPKLSNWGEPLLIGPGSIHVAHTDGEYIEKQQLAEAIGLYCTIARQLAKESLQPA